MQSIKINALADNAMQNRDLNHLKGGYEYGSDLWGIGCECKKYNVSKDHKKDDHKPSSSCGYCAYEMPIGLEP